MNDYEKLKALFDSFGMTYDAGESDAKEFVNIIKEEKDGVSYLIEINSKHKKVEAYSMFLHCFTLIRKGNLSRLEFGNNY